MFADDDDDNQQDDWAVVETTKIYDFVRPLGSMFVWVRFDFASHPLRRHFAAAQLSRALWVFWTRKPYLCLVSPGELFAPTGEIRDGDAFNCFRLCFAAAEADQIGDISKRFANGAQDFWKIKRKEKIQELLDDAGDDGDDVMRGNTGLSLMTGMC